MPEAAPAAALEGRRTSPRRRGATATLALVALTLVAMPFLGGGSSQRGDIEPAPARKSSEAQPMARTAGETDCTEPAVPLRDGVLRGDVTADGCPEHVVWDGRHIAVHTGDGAPPRRYALHAHNEQVLLGDWSCDGRATLAVYRPSTGQVFVFEDWAQPGAAESGAESPPRAARDGSAVVDRTAGCDRVRVRP